MTNEELARGLFKQAISRYKTVGEAFQNEEYASQFPSIDQKSIAEMAFISRTLRGDRERSMDGDDILHLPMKKRRAPLLKKELVLFFTLIGLDLF